jgi:histidine phosphotransfer protein HptB
VALYPRLMAYDPGAIDATLAAAVGDEPGLIAELRESFLDSVKRALEAMKSSDSPDGWTAAALRLKGLAASFGAVRLMALAQEAAAGQAHDPAVLRRLHRAADRL